MFHLWSELNNILIFTLKTATESYEFDKNGYGEVNLVFLLAFS